MPAGEEVAQYLIGMGADLDRLDADIRTAHQMVGRGIERMNTQAGGIKMGFDPSAALRFARNIGAIGIAIAGSIAAVVELSDKIDRDLARSLDIAGANSASASAEFQEFAESLETSSGKSQNEIKKLGATIATLSGVSGKDLENLTMIALGLEKRFGQVGLTGRQAAELLARGIREGDLSGFEKFGISMQGTLNVHQQYGRVVEQANRGLDEMEGHTETVTGTLAHMRNRATEVAREIGGLFSLDGPGQSFLSNLNGGINEFADGLIDAIPLIRELTGGWLDFLNVDIGPLADMASMVRELRDATSDLLLLFFDLSPEEYAKAVDVVRKTTNQEAEERRRQRERSADQNRISPDFSKFGSRRAAENDSISTAFGDLRIPSADAALRVQQEIRNELIALHKTYNQRMNEQRDQTGFGRGPNWVRK